MWGTRTRRTTRRATFRIRGRGLRVFGFRPIFGIVRIVI
jgi:hypothetical protein